MKKNKIIQFSLVIGGIILFFLTYYSDNKDEIADVDKNVSISDVGKLTENTSNVITDINYTGTNNKGTFFELNAAVARVKYGEPNISHLEDGLYLAHRILPLQWLRLIQKKCHLKYQHSLHSL